MNDRYEIVRLIGKGRTGGVYEAIDSVLSRKVAVRRFFSEHGNTDTSRWADEFEHLTNHLTRFEHPSLCVVYDAGIDDDGAYVITEFLNYPTLHDRLKNGRVELREFWDLAVHILEALSIPHASGFAHSGLSTRSIMLRPRKRGDILYKLVDLGHIWLTPLINPDNPMLRLSDPSIMAPELFEGKPATPATDVYMFGMLLYRSLAGGNPLAGLPFEDAYQRHIQHAFAPVTGYRTSVPPEVSNWLEILTQADPQLRPQNAASALALLPDINHVDPLYFQPDISAAIRVKAEPEPAPQPLPQPNYIPQSDIGFAYQRSPNSHIKKLPKPMASAHQSNAPVVIMVVGGIILLLLLLALAL